MTEFSLVVGIAYGLGAFGALAIVWGACLGRRAMRQTKAIAFVIANLPCVTIEGCHETKDLTT